MTRTVTTSILAVSAIALALAFGSAQIASAAPLADGLVAYWNLNEGAGTNANDPVNNYDGTFNGTAAWMVSSVVIGSSNAASLNGTDAYIEVPENSDLDTAGPITVAGWIYVDSSAAQQGTVAAKWNDLGVDERGYLLSVHTDETPQFYVSHTGVDFPSATGAALSDGWHHLAGTYDGTDIKLYVDGVLAATTNSPGTIFLNNEPLLIGANDGYGGALRKFTTGAVDEVRLYNRALTAAEVGVIKSHGETVIALTPEDDTNPVGTNHTVTADIGSGLAYIPLLFEVSGANLAGGLPYVYTDGNGEADFTYTGVNAGVDPIIACSDVSWFVTGGGICNAPFDEPDDTATKTWVNTYDISGMKYKDSDADGVKDVGEIGLENWVIFVDENGNGTYEPLVDLVSDTTDVNGAYSIGGVVNGTYDVCEVNQVNYVQTSPSPSCHEVEVSGADVTDVDFGNAHLVPTTGSTKGFWANKNGEAQLMDGGTAATELALLSGLNLRNANGSAFDPATYAQLKTWLNKATAKNMAYMLSAQLASTELAVEAGFLAGGTLVYAPDSDLSGITSPLGFISITALMAEANTELGVHGTAVEGDAWWAYQDALRAVLDAVNSDAVIAVEP